MKTFPKFPAAFLVFAFTLSGCVKDTVKNTYTYTYFEPVYKAYSEVVANIKSNASTAVSLPGKIAIIGKYIFLNEVDKGIHIIDNSNPSSPQNIAFIDVPGNVDIAIKGNILYADFYTDLVAIDIRDPRNATVKKIIKNIFPERSYYGYMADTSLVITGWIKKTATMDGNYPPVICYMGALQSSADASASFSNKAAATPIGINGSLSRFALVSGYLYSVSYDSLRITDVEVPDNPELKNAISVGWGVETVFPFKDKLFMGANNGMFIYSISDPLNPVKLGNFQHVRTCDPVIADDNKAYVTLHGGTQCGGFTNQLDVLNIADILSPQLIKTYPLSSPRGLSKDGNLLFVCDGADGLKVFDAADANNIKLLKRFDMEEANDVIAYNNIALVMATDAIYQFDYSNVAGMKLLSKISIQKR
jgi:hypothetical protein